MVAPPGHGPKPVPPGTVVVVTMVVADGSVVVVVPVPTVAEPGEPISAGSLAATNAPLVPVSLSCGDRTRQPGRVVERLER